MPRRCGTSLMGPQGGDELDSLMHAFTFEQDGSEKGAHSYLGSWFVPWSGGWAP
jgi:hypothetical protein